MLRRPTGSPSASASARHKTQGAGGLVIEHHRPLPLSACLPVCLSPLVALPPAWAFVRELVVVVSNAKSHTPVIDAGVSHGAGSSHRPSGARVAYKRAATVDGPTDLGNVETTNRLPRFRFPLWQDTDIRGRWAGDRAPPPPSLSVCLPVCLSPLVALPPACSSESLWIIESIMFGCYLASRPPPTSLLSRPVIAERSSYR